MIKKNGSGRQQSSVYKTNSHESEDHWLKQFEDTLAKSAVQSRQVDRSLFDRINSIMNGAQSKYTSIDQKLEDMRNRSGLTQYLQANVELEQNKKKASPEEEHQKFIDAAEKAVLSQDWFLLGKLYGEYDKKNNEIVNGAESIRLARYGKIAEVPLQAWLNYTIGYGEGAQLSQEKKDKDFKFTSQVIDSVVKRNRANRDKRASQEGKSKKPTVIEKCPQILNTLQNYITDSKGNLAIPAIISKIRSIHGKDIPESEDWEDENLIKLISDLNLEAKKNNPAHYRNESNLGKNDNGELEIDPSNMDAFHGLTPAKI